MKQRNEKTAKQHVGADSRACPGSVNKSLLAKIKNDQRGLTLLEVVLAMAIASLVILPAGMLLVNTVKAYNIVEERNDAMISIPVGDSEEHRTIGDVLTQFRQDVNATRDNDVHLVHDINGGSHGDDGVGITTGNQVDGGLVWWRWDTREPGGPTFNLTRQEQGENEIIMLENVHKVTFVKYRELGGTRVRRYIFSWDRANGTPISDRTYEWPSPFPYPNFKSGIHADWRGEMIIELRPGGPGTPLIVYRAGATSRMWHNEEMN